MRAIFVFGSNLAGRHGKGAALIAKNKYGAIYGQSIGLQGNSYAIPTKDEKIRTLHIARIRSYINQFITFACENDDMLFYVTAIGCGLAGYRPEEIAPLFRQCPPNVRLNKSFLDALNPRTTRCLF